MIKRGKTKAVIVAAGKGTRMGADCNKQYILLRNKPVLAYTLDVFNSSPDIDEIVVVVAGGEVDFCRDNVVDKYGFTKVSGIIEGGKERYDSVYKGLMAAEEDCSIILIHDGARPFISQEIILNTIETAKETGAVIVGVPLKDTVKIVNNDLEVVETPERKKLWSIQTPQTFKYSLIKEVYEKGYLDEGITDDASLVERWGYPVKVIMGSYQNIKLTTPDDLLLAEEILKKGELE